MSSIAHVYDFHATFDRGVTVRLFAIHNGNADGRLNGDGESPCSEQKMARFRTHYLTKERAYVSTQQSGQFDTFLFNHFSVHCFLA